MNGIKLKKPQSWKYVEVYGDGNGGGGGGRTGAEMEKLYERVRDGELVRGWIE